MCRESYPDVEKHTVDIATVEAEWPRFHERSKEADQAATVNWGSERIGRIPPFVWEDGKAIPTPSAEEGKKDGLQTLPCASAGGEGMARQRPHTYASAGDVRVRATSYADCLRT